MPLYATKRKRHRAFQGNKINQKAASDLSDPLQAPLETCMFPSLDTVSLLCPQLARRYPDVNLELQGRVVSAPALSFSPGSLSLAPEMDIEAFALLPAAGREPVFRLGVVRPPPHPLLLLLGALPNSPPVRFPQASA